LLQQQVQDFSAVLQTIEATHNTIEHEVLNSTISRAREIVQELQSVITAKLLKKNAGSNSNAKRRGWVRYRSKIVKLRENLEYAQTALMAAQNENILCEPRAVRILFRIDMSNAMF